ncbi:MAG: VF530 family protein [Verrucomicrobia bacterium]|nr:VF530 family protein [Verrucomicrobiota bacterium]
MHDEGPADTPEKTPPQSPNPNPKDRMHGVTLEMMLNRLVEKLGWEEMSDRIRIRCFANDPSISSSLKFLRKTQWARVKIERLYRDVDFSDESQARNQRQSQNQKPKT